MEFNVHARVTIKGSGDLPIPDFIFGLISFPVVSVFLQTSMSFGIQTVSQSTISRIRNSVFRNVDVRKGGFNFSKCSECEHLKDLIDMSIKGGEEREI